MELRQKLVYGLHKDRRGSTTPGTEESVRSVSAVEGIGTDADWDTSRYVLLATDRHLPRKYERAGEDTCLDFSIHIHTLCW